MQTQFHQINHNVMERDQIKEQLHLRIEQADDRLLHVLTALTEAWFDQYPQTAMLSAYEDALRPMTQEELVERALESERAIQAGEAVDIEEILGAVPVV
ncbi:MAG: hypothetical protein R2795_16210 [Saprospiraceae bacterium]